MPEQQFKEYTSPEAPSQKPAEKEQVGDSAKIEKESINVEKKVVPQEKQVQSSSNVPMSTTPTASTAPAVVKTQILSEDLKEIFQQMDAQHKAEFKKAGTETATAIELLISTAKLTAKKVATLISAWLKLVPGINQYFLEKEAKIKTDKILEINKVKEGEDK